MPEAEQPCLSPRSSAIGRGSRWHTDCSKRVSPPVRPASIGGAIDMVKCSAMPALLITICGIGSAAAQTDVKSALDWKFEGPAAPYFVAIDKGYYKAEGLNVTIDSGPGSVAGIARVAAGTYPIGFFDINSLVKFQDQNPDKKVQAVLMMYDK